MTEAQEAKSGPVDPNPIKTVRQREAQCFAGRLLSNFLGPITRQKPGLWTHRTFLLLQLKIYERLLFDDGRFGPKEYYEIGRTLSEILKGQAEASGDGGGDGVEFSPEALAERLRVAMQRVYGTNYQATDASPSSP